LFFRYLLGFSTDKLRSSLWDVLIVGSGVAGLSVALKLGNKAKTLLITKGSLSESSSYEAQGGVAVALSPEDSFEKHAEDTLKVGDGLSSEEVSRIVAREGIERIKELLKIKISFDRLNGDFDYSLEGGHSRPRILHRADQTGKAIVEGLKKELKRLNLLEVREKTTLVDVLTLSNQVVGALVLSPEGEPEIIRAKVIVLATGGLGEVYSHTTNPPVATGDGLAAAFRAGAQIADMEFVQFHPTALDQASHRRLLLTEALRGEGAFLLNQQGKRIMEGVHPLKELAPRFLVVRQMVEEQKKGNRVFLDCRHLPAEKIKTKFRYVWQRLEEAGFNLVRDLIPVAPAAHFSIGGIKTDLWGFTGIKGLYACGEVAATYLHGANRLASNSLLEGLVFGWRVGEAVEDNLKTASPFSYPETGEEISFEVKNKSKVGLKLSELRGELGKLMLEKAGPVRNEDYLKDLVLFLETNKQVMKMDFISRDYIELVNLWTVAWLIARAAQERRESRGVHFREDFPERNDSKFLGHFIFQRGEDHVELEFYRKDS